MSQTKPKKHHFVPRFLLKNFCAGKKESVFVFDTQTGNQYQASIYDAAAENYFYTYSDEILDIDTEQKLSKLEGLCAPIFKKIVKAESLVNVSESERILLCLFAAVQHLRTNTQREILSQINRGLSDWFRSMGFDPNHDVENFKELNAEEIKNATIANMHRLGGEIALHFVDKELLLVKAPDGTEFYISDHPITLYNYFPRPGRGNLGLALPGIEIHFPISSHLSLSFVCAGMLHRMRRVTHQVRLLKSQGLVIPVDLTPVEHTLRQFDRQECRELQPDNVEFHNFLQVSQCIRYLYSKSGNFELAIDMLKTDPEIRNPPNFTGLYPKILEAV